MSIKHWRTLFLLSYQVVIWSWANHLSISGSFVNRTFQVLEAFSCLVITICEENLELNHFSTCFPYFKLLPNFFISKSFSIFYASSQGHNYLLKNCNLSPDRSLSLIHLSAIHWHLVFCGSKVHSNTCLWRVGQWHFNEYTCRCYVLLGPVEILTECSIKKKVAAITTEQPGNRDIQRWSKEPIIFTTISSLAKVSLPCAS